MAASEIRVRSVQVSVDAPVTVRVVRLTVTERLGEEYRYAEAGAEPWNVSVALSSRPSAIPSRFLLQSPAQVNLGGRRAVAFSLGPNECAQVTVYSDRQLAALLHISGFSLAGPVVRDAADPSSGLPFARRLILCDDAMPAPDPVDAPIVLDMDIFADAAPLHLVAARWDAANHQVTAVPVTDGNTIAICTEPHHVAAPGAAMCAPCPAGSLPLPARLRCLSCDGNAVRPDGEATCTACPANLTASLDHTRCETECPANAVPDEAGGCTVCPVGSMPVGPATARRCVECADGTVRADPNAVVCSPCPAGSRPTGSKDGCELCPAGTVRTAADAAAGVGDCRPCPGGAAASDGPANACVVCDAAGGFVVDETGAGCRPLCDPCVGSHVLSVPSSSGQTSVPGDWGDADSSVCWVGGLDVGAGEWEADDALFTVLEATTSVVDGRWVVRSSVGQDGARPGIDVHVVCASRAIAAVADWIDGAGRDPALFRQVDAALEEPQTRTNTLSLLHRRVLFGLGRAFGHDDNSALLPPFGVIGEVPVGACTVTSGVIRNGELNEDSHTSVLSWYAASDPATDAGVSIIADVASERAHDCLSPGDNCQFGVLCFPQTTTRVLSSIGSFPLTNPAAPSLTVARYSGNCGTPIAVTASAGDLCFVGGVHIASSLDADSNSRMVWWKAIKAGATWSVSSSIAHSGGCSVEMDVVCVHSSAVSVDGDATYFTTN